MESMPEDIIQKAVEAALKEEVGKVIAELPMNRQPDTKEERVQRGYESISTMEERNEILRQADTARRLGLGRKESNAYIKSKFDELARDRDLQKRGFKPQHGTRYWRDSSGTYIDPETGLEVE